MKNVKLFFICTILSIFFLQGCEDIKMDMGEVIVPPQNKLIPINGTWKIGKKIGFRNELLRTKQNNSWVGKSVIFSESNVVFGDEIYTDLEYKMKNIDTKNYFLYTYKVNYRDLGLDVKYIEVISITSNDKHFNDFIVIPGEKLIVSIDNDFYYLNKISDETKETPMKIANENQLPKEKSRTEPDLMRSGVLIGLRSNSVDKQHQIAKDSYRTLWIASKNRNISSIMEIPNLFVPRKNGFWVVGMDRQEKNGYVKDRLFAYPYGNNLQNDKEIENESTIQEYVIRNIRFMGNDYIATEYMKTPDLLKNRLKRLQVLPIDNIENNMGINISDITGELGKNAMISSANGYLSTLDENEVKKLNRTPREDSFTLARRNGHWIMFGRLYYKNQDDEDNFKDFHINLFPPIKMVNYDEFYLSWNTIKEKVPEAIDGYISPNRDIAMIVTNNAIYIYNIKNHQLSNRYMEKIKLKEGESVVMAEWATGNYVDKWQNICNDAISLITD